MGGPIVRSYGMPNWDDIFGKKDKGKSAGKAKTKASAKKKPAAKKAPAKKSRKC